MVDVEVGSSEWLLARRQGVTASEIGGLLGIAPEVWSSPFNLYWNKAAGLGAPVESAAMAWGRDLEEAVLRRFAREHPELVLSPSALYRRSDRPWQMATPDALALDASGAVRLGVVQAKTSSRREEWGEPGTDQIPAHYAAQVRWDMDVLGVQVAFVPVLFAGRDYAEYLVPQDVEDVALMRAEAQAFLDRLACADPPPVDHRPATLRTLRQLHPDVEDFAVEVDPAWIEQYRTARAEIAAAKRRRDEAEAHLRDQLGTAAVGTVDGDRVCSRSVYTTRDRQVAGATVHRLTVHSRIEPMEAS